MEGALRKNCLYLPASASNRERQICEEVLIDIQNELHQHNRYVIDFQQMCQIADEDLNDASFVLTEKERPSIAGPRTQTAHYLS